MALKIAIQLIHLVESTRRHAKWLRVLKGRGRLQPTQELDQLEGASTRILNMPTSSITSRSSQWDSRISRTSKTSTNSTRLLRTSTSQTRAPLITASMSWTTRGCTLLESSITRSTWSHLSVARGSKSTFRGPKTRRLPMQASRI